MANPVSDLFIQNTVLSFPIDGQAYDFTVSYTAFGEVLSVVNHLLDLPEEAHFLMLGKETRNIIRRLQFHRDRFRFYLPLVALQVVADSPWETIGQRIADLQAKPAFPGEPQREHFRDEWVWQLWSLPASKAEEELNWLFRLLSEEQDELASALRQADEARIRLAAPILLHTLVYSSDEAYQESVVRMLGEQQDPELLNYLSGILRQPDQRPRHGPALLGLSYYKRTDLRALLLAYYQEQTRIEASSMVHLIRGLGVYRDENIKEILLQELSGDSIEVGNEAFSALREHAVTEEELAAHLRASFDRKLSPEHLTNTLAQYRKLARDPLLPEADELINLLVRANSRHKEKDLNSHITALLQRKKTGATFTRLFDLIEQRRGTPIEGAVFDVLGEIGAESALKVILFFLDEPSITAREEARKAVRAIAERNQRPEVISLLIKTLPNPDLQLRHAVIRALLPILRNYQNPDALPLIMEALKDEPAAVREQILSALRPLPETKSRSALLHLKQGTDLQAPKTGAKQIKKSETEATPPEQKHRERKREERQMIALMLILFLVMLLLTLKFCKI
jgi:HEAT repeat protein